MSDAWMSAQMHVGERPREYVTVREWPDAPGCVEICTDGCEDHYGPQSIVMSPAMARKLAEVLNRVADIVEAEA